ncbi:LOW QUALITY PROTEIN: uncharacterized protein LOC125469697 [Pyrus x bretschneideri]|uniref:LOW QUALITY PROTEIN: uncharacterized protein LOC125469697 n=1 Tax=Pyrus x bretschneideri TaxID=225117 RepID=UPI00202F99C1|nr:LOW QUALITY PROTEIN: uncharacterized protein LOC125469697 [Pyrus x bretschneideri]
MLDGLLGRGFASKCKTLIKLTKTRIDVIRRKRNATQKFLKKDIADLLSSGLDINAYGRADGLTAEVILSSCYDFVERCCDLVLKNLSVMQKQSECPEECKEPVSSLMIAAARFSDLPELRDLRQLFQERYANALDLFVNQKFVENIASKPPTLEKKVQLMKDIAVEFSINWDSKAFVQSMSKPPSAIPQDKPKTYGPSHVSDDKAKLSSGKSAVPKGDKHNLFPTEKRLDFNDAQKLHKEKDGAVLKKEEHVHQTRHKAFGIEHKSLSAREDTVEKDGLGILFGERQEVASHKYEAWTRRRTITFIRLVIDPLEKSTNLLVPGKILSWKEMATEVCSGKATSCFSQIEAWNRKEDAPPKSVRLGSSSQGNGQEKHHERENNVPKREHEALPCVQPIVAGPHVKSNGQGLFAGDNYGGQHSDAKLAIKEEEMPKLKPPYNYGAPPPYVKPNAKAKDRKHEAKDGSGSKRITKDPVAYNIAFVDNILGGVNVGSDDEDEMPGAAKANKHNHEKDRAHRDDASSNHIPKPRSSRARSSRSRSSHNDAGNSEDTEVGIRKTRSRRKDESRRGLQLLFDDEHYKKDEEERRMDELLIHYSKKPSNVEPEMSRRKSRSRHAHHHAGTGVKESPGQASRDESETVPTAVRSVSLPNEHSGPSEAPKVFARAASFQPDRSNPAKHVHPKLPNYEDLAAQFAALRGR